MDGIAKFVGYVALVLIAMAGWNHFSEQRQTAADPCRQLETVQWLNRIGPEILKTSQDFGDNITPQLTACQYFADKDTILMSVRVGWTGPFSGDYYEKSGRITVANKEWRWEETGANGTLMAYRLMTGVVSSLVNSPR